MSSLKYSSFAEFRRDLRGSTNWSTHIDEIAATAFQIDDDKDKPHKHALFDRFEDFDEDDE